MSSTPTSIGRYRVKEVIGTGTFATVYRATDVHLDTDVAVKVLAENHSLAPEVRRRFIEEGRRLRRAASTHVLAVHDLDDTERAQPFLVLELADRGDLAARVAECRLSGRAPSPGDGLAVARALTDALDVLHRHQLVHRDLAPRNLLLRSAVRDLGAVAAPDATVPDGAPFASGLIAGDEDLVLGDLGLAKDLARASGLTVATGTSGFAAPEQRRSGIVDQRADIWAASALVVWLAIDRAPEEAETWREEFVSAGWPEEAVEVLAHGLADDPERRPGSVTEWCTGLGDAMGPVSELSGVVPVPGALDADPNSDSGSGRDRRLARPGWIARLAFGLGLVALGALGGWVVHGLASGGGASVAISSPEPGVERVVVEEHGVEIMVEGPVTVSAGEQVELEATVDGAETWQWVAPDHQFHPETDSLRVTPQTPGQATVRLQAFDEANRVVEATHRLEIEPAGVDE